jgi:hypothetical protein
VLGSEYRQRSCVQAEQPAVRRVKAEPAGGEDAQQVAVCHKRDVTSG